MAGFGYALKIQAMGIKRKTSNVNQQRAKSVNIERTLCGFYPLCVSTSNRTVSFDQSIFNIKEALKPVDDFTFTFYAFYRCPKIHANCGTGRSVAMWLWWIRTVEATGSRHSVGCILFYFFILNNTLTTFIAIRFHNSFALIPFYMRGTMTNVITVHSEFSCLMRASSCRPIGPHRFEPCCR